MLDSFSLLRIEFGEVQLLQFNREGLGRDTTRTLVVNEVDAVNSVD
jgi:hypothetical protein